MNFCKTNKTELILAISKAVIDVQLFREFVGIDPVLRVVYNGMYIERVS